MIFNIETLSSKQFSELNHRLEPYFLGASGHNVAPAGKEPKWEVTVCTSDLCERMSTVNTLDAISKTVAQAVTVPYYSIDELPDDVQRRLIDKVIADNIYRDDWEHEREKSFNNICETLNLSWGRYSGGCIWVELKSDYIDDRDVKGAKRVIAYINNRWDFKTPAYTNNSKLKALRKKGVLAKNHMEDNIPTGYTADYCCAEAYSDFLELARKMPDTVTLEDFCRLLAGAFMDEEEKDYEQTTSDEYVKEYLFVDHYYTWEGKDITDLVNQK